MNSFKTNLFLGTLLHDIGKMWQRGEHRYLKHDALSAAAVKELFDQPIVTAIARYHHKAELVTALQRGELQREDSILAAVIAGEADNLASGERLPAPGETADRLMRSIFSSINLPAAPVANQASPPVFHQPISSLLFSQYQFPQLSPQVDPNTYDAAWQAFFTDLSIEVKDQIYDPDNVYYLCKKHLWCIPSTYYKNVADVSLFEHSRLAAALALCQYDYLSEKHADDLGALRQAVANRQEERYLLVCADFTGIQKFIYQVAHRGALKALKGRSFLLQHLLDEVAFAILNELELSHANLIYSSGGKLYLLLPNLPKARDIVEVFCARCNEELLRIYRGEVAIVTASVSLNGHDFCSPKSGSASIPFVEKWEEVNAILAKQSKLQKFKERLKDPHFFLTPAAEYPSGSVVLCYATGHEICTQEDLQSATSQTVRTIPGYLKRTTAQGIVFYELIDEELPANLESKYLSEEQFEAQRIGGDLKRQNREEWNGIFFQAEQPFPLFNQLFTEGFTLQRDPQAVYSRVILLNDFNFAALNTFTGKKSFRFYGGNWQYDLRDHAAEGLFEYWQDQSQQQTGMGYLAVLRMDVDNLGAIFQRGLVDEKGQSIATFSRVVQLSFLLDYFFAGYLNSLRDAHWSASTGVNTSGEGIPLEETLLLVYSGGDDLFLVGRWEVIPDVALYIHERFEAFTGANPSLTLSAGIALFKAQQPLFKVAELAGAAESLAKKYTWNGQKKNAIAFLGQAMHWSDFQQVSALTKAWSGWMRQTAYPLPKSFVKTIQGIFTEFLDAMRADRLARHDAEYPNSGNILQEEMSPAFCGPYYWRAAYRFKQMLGRIPEPAPYRTALAQLSKEIFTNHQSEKPYLFLMYTAALWADYLTRQNK